MPTDLQKIITLLEMLSGSLTSAEDVSRVQRWIAEVKESASVLPAKANGKEPKQLLIDTHRTLIRAAKQIESSLGR